MVVIGYADESLSLNSNLILNTTDLKPIADFISDHISESQTEENPETGKLFRYCLKKYPNHLSDKLCKLYLCSDYNDKIRTKSIGLLLDALIYLNRNNQFLSTNTLKDLKPLLVSCLRLQETLGTDFKILSSIVSAICIHVFGSESTDDGTWYEFEDYMAAMVDLDIRKVFLIFHKLPPIMYDEFLMLISGKLFSAIVERLCLFYADFEDWVLAFKTGFTYGIHMAESSRNDLSNNMLYELISSAIETVKAGKEGRLKRALMGLMKPMREDANRYSRMEYEFVSELLHMIWKIHGIDEDLKTMVSKMSWMIEKRKRV